MGFDLSEIRISIKKSPKKEVGFNFLLEYKTRTGFFHFFIIFIQKVEFDNSMLAYYYRTPYLCYIIVCTHTNQSIFQTQKI